MHFVIIAIAVALILMGVSNPLFSYLSFIVLAAYIVFSSNETAFSVMAFFMPFANIIKPSVNTTSLFTYLTIILVIKLLITCKVVKVSFFVAWGFLFVIQIMGCFGNIPVLIKQSMILLLIYGYFNSCKRIKKEFTVSLAVGLSLSCIIASFSSFIPGLSSYMSNIKAYEISVDVLRFTGLYSDPNYLSLTIVLALTALIILIKTKKISKKYMIIGSVLIYYGLLTISKSFYIMLVAVFIFYFVLSIKKRQYIVSGIFIAVAIALVIFLINDKSVLFDYIIRRLFYSSDITTGRTDIWLQYVKYFISNPFKLIFGSGISAVTFTTVAHNTYIDFLYYYGIYNSFVFFLGVILALRNQRISFKLQNTIPMMYLLIMSFALSCLQMYDFAFLLTFTLEFLVRPKKQIVYEKEI